MLGKQGRSGVELSSLLLRLDRERVVSRALASVLRPSLRSKRNASSYNSIEQLPLYETDDLSIAPNYDLGILVKRITVPLANLLSRPIERYVNGGNVH